ncbi:uncharacterized protein LOC110457086 [Mizuhopecten yessoensis]|uniref:uncharacterized protein LOC110457086 n=1 Tax=Mizuhopecten yessoensis TaxID=6573 RepID=UPI000B45B301|nr:uncharacterized protein LOC110457086 [Mizuhopecten yessoensis]
MMKVWISRSLSFLLLLTDCVWSLKCWHCIADDCDKDPGGNYKAEERSCEVGQHCQKIFFEMYSTTDNRKYKSTVRGCAWDCLNKNDFINCTRDMFSSRGCIEKSCCTDKDLCNAAVSLTENVNTRISFIVIFSVLFNLLINR